MNLFISNLTIPSIFPVSFRHLYCFSKPQNVYGLPLGDSVCGIYAHVQSRTIADEFVMRSCVCTSETARGF